MSEVLKGLRSKIKTAASELLYRIDPARDVRSVVDAFTYREGISLPEAYKRVAETEERLGKENGSLRPVFDGAVDQFWNDMWRRHRG
jgi:hypothetical protein